MNHPSLEIFHPLIRNWFLEKYRTPTEIQEESWPVIARDEHVLITAPTGSGKTLTAFLWALNQLITRVWTSGKTRVLYISPMKALNNDIRINLLDPLGELERLFDPDDFPPLSVQTRSGDTPQNERQRMLRHPPEILITTPESLNLLLSSPKARNILHDLQTVILDEIHAVAGDKRGTHLMTAVDRLVRLSGDFQRICLSATVKPLQKIAEFVGGYTLAQSNKQYRYTPRPVAIIRAAGDKQLELKVRFPKNAREKMEDNSWFPPLVEQFRNIIRANRSTLLFTNTRRLSEKVTRLINEAEGEQMAYAHHGSLSKEVRLVVEQRLKAGDLQAIVATSSLELGIDIGELDEVVLIESPFSVASALQRIGRSGHSVGRVSRGTLFPTHGRDFLNAAIMARSVAEQDIEQTRPVEAPLDVLAQVILSMTAMETWDLDELFAVLRTCSAYHGLSRSQFDLILEMLAGRYADSRIRELKPRLSIDRLDNTARARDGVLMQLYQSGGTIPDRGYFDLRIKDSAAKIGELDEEFVWERSVGDRFTLGNQTWRILAMDAQKVEVVPWDGPVNSTVFWKAEKGNRDFGFFDRLGRFLENWNDLLQDPRFYTELTANYCMEGIAAEELVAFLQRQRDITGCDLPHRHHLVVEYNRGKDRSNPQDGLRIVLHTLWGGRVNAPLALILAAAWEQEYGQQLEVLADDDCIMLVAPEDLDMSKLLQLVHPGNVEPLLRRKLESSGYFGARFRENAGRALLLPRGGFKRRMPLWLTRLRAKKLLDAVMGFEDFPILVETWRTCLHDFDLAQLKSLLDELDNGEIRITAVRTTSPAPFSQSLVWRQTDKHMYADDTPSGGRLSGLSREVLQEVLFSAQLRPQLDPELLRQFQAKLQRIETGYTPASIEEILDWVKERILIPVGEWRLLLEGMARDHNFDQETLVELKDKLLWVCPSGGSEDSICALEMLPRLTTALGPENQAGLTAGDLLTRTKHPLQHYLDDLPAYPLEEAAQQMDLLYTVVAEWLRFYGPIDSERIRSVFGLASEQLQLLLASLAENQTVVMDVLIRDDDRLYVCDTENLEILLRLQRRASRPVFRALPQSHLPLYLAAFQGLTGPGWRTAGAGNNEKALQEVLETLFGFPAPAGIWEADILPARLTPYYRSWLDSVVQDEMIWFGCGRERLGFSPSGDCELFLPSGPGDDKQTEALLPDSRGRFKFWDIADHTGVDRAELYRTLWRQVWAGRMSAEPFDVVRRGIENRFEPGGGASAERPRSRYSRRSSGRGWESAGTWFELPETPADIDLLYEEELKKDRVRQLLDRYGILFRELLSRELPQLRWSALFRTLRIMELSGEIISGHFFEGIQGLQFASPEAFKLLQEGLPTAAVYWYNAVDPASICGLGLTWKSEGLDLPSRLPSTHLVFQADRLVLVSRKRGRQVEIAVPPEEEALPEILSFFSVQVSRDFNPWKAVRVEQINGQPAGSSHYADVFVAGGFRKDYKTLILRARY